MITFKQFMEGGEDKFSTEILSSSGKLVAVKRYENGFTLGVTIGTLRSFIKNGYKFMCSHDVQRDIASRDPSLLVYLYDKEKLLDPVLKEKYSHLIMGDKFGVFDND